MSVRRKKKYKNHEDYLKYQEEKRKQEESMNESDRKLLESFRETSNMNKGYTTYKKPSERINHIPPSVIESNPHKEGITINSRRAAYHEKSHCYDLNAYATLVSSGIKPEEAKKILKYFYDNIIDELHENEPQFKKNNINTNEKKPHQNNYRNSGYFERR